VKRYSTPFYSLQGVSISDLTPTDHLQHHTPSMADTWIGFLSLKVSVDKGVKSELNFLCIW